MVPLLQLVVQVGQVVVLAASGKGSKQKSRVRQSAMFLTLGIFLLAVLTSSRVVTHEWVYLDYDWQTPDQRRDYINSGKYIVENNALAGGLFQSRFLSDF